MVKILIKVALIALAVPAILYATAYSSLYIESMPISDNTTPDQSVSENKPKQQARVYTRYPHLWFSSQCSFQQ